MRIGARAFWNAGTVFGLATIYVLTGPWKTRDEKQYESISKVATEVSLRLSSLHDPDTVAKCLLRLPPTLLNLSRLRAGKGVTLINPAQHMLVTVAQEGSGSILTVQRPPKRSLRPPHVVAVTRCSV